MKRLIALILSALTLCAIACAFSACVEEDGSTYLKYGEKYTFVRNYTDDDGEFSTTRYTKNTIVFNEDKTGTYDGYDKYDKLDSDTFDYVKSYTIKFKWRWADAEKSGIYIFETERIYHKENSKGRTAELNDGPYIVGEDFVASSETIYILESADIYGVEDKLNNKK